MKARLVRFASSTEQGTFGKLFINDGFVCVTVEQPWRFNLRQKSCVPDGLYKLYPFNSANFGFTWRLHNSALDVYIHEKERARKSDRFAIDFHVGNYANDVFGCIAVGDTLGANGGEWMVLNSAKTMRLLRKVFIEENINQLEITSTGDKKIWDDKI